jgi:hypothetical protein
MRWLRQQILPIFGLPDLSANRLGAGLDRYPPILLARRASATRISN